MKSHSTCAALYLFAFGVLLVTCNLLCQVSEAQKPEQASLDLAKLKSPDLKTREATAAAFSLARKKHINELLQLANLKGKDNEYSGTKELAIQLLGEARAPEAIAFCLEHVTFIVPRIILDDEGWIDSYPCAAALIAIGTPVYEKLWPRMMFDRMEDLEIKLLAEIVRSIDGYDIGLARLEAQRGTEKPKAEFQKRFRANLDRLIKRYKDPSSK